LTLLAFLYYRKCITQVYKNPVEKNIVRVWIQIIITSANDKELLYVNTIKIYIFSMTIGDSFLYYVFYIVTEYISLLNRISLWLYLTESTLNAINGITVYQWSWY
jgi:hypothetical protein